MIASIALLAIAIVATGGFATFAAAGLIVMDIATVANILVPALISGEPLTGWDIATIALVGVANAGVIFKAIRPVLKEGSDIGKVVGGTRGSIEQIIKNPEAGEKIAKNS